MKNVCNKQAQGDIFKCPILSEQQMKKQRCAVNCEINREKMQIFAKISRKWAESSQSIRPFAALTVSDARRTHFSRYWKGPGLIGFESM